VLVGTYEHRLDAKARLVLPARFREALGSRMTATVGIDPCVAIYSPEGWSALLERLERLSLSKGRSRDFLRVLLASAGELEPDGAGRILLPPSLLQYAALEGEVVVIGVGNRIEIWNRERWERRREIVLADLSALAEEVETL